MEQVKHTATLAGTQAKDVATSTAQTAQITRSGGEAVEHAIVGLQEARERMHAIAQSVASLSEQSKTIGDIIDAVTDLSEQSNLLAVNAAIEAAKAGEQGKGFAVVAQEVRHLARQSKDATAQVQTILHEIQKAANVAVLVTDQGTSAVEIGVTQSIDANQSIRVLAKNITDATQAITRIATSSQQQIAGIDQVATALTSVKHASTENLESIRNLHTAVQQLHTVGQTLQNLIKHYTAEKTLYSSAVHEHSV
jgi:methyl-accepting chemotaxis protein